MSSRYSSEATYHCGNGCRQSGCPGHTLKIWYHDTSDTVTVMEDGKLYITFDCVQWSTLRRLANEDR